MKKFLFTSAVVASLALGTSASANTGTEEVSGTTPAQGMYTLDLFLEDLKLAFTFDNEKEADLLLRFAQERLAEDKAMTEEEQAEFLTEAIEGYTDLLEKAEDTVSEVITDEDTSDVVKEELSNELEETANVDKDLAGQLEEDQAEELGNKTDEAYLVANVVKGYDVGAVKDLRSQDFGYGEIAKILSLSEASGKSVEEVVALLEGKGFGEVYKELGVTVAQVKEAALTTKITNLEESLAAARESGDEKAVTKLEKKLEALSKKKDRLAKTEETSEATENDTTVEETPVATENDKTRKLQK
ncbi:DUF5667 domain-containing protein [Bacillus sp. T33-2]|uniref:DUF5667 domain-containing protein n=1 Tax=Bacillus sp. T33-2 TaxID=2054168 RepID=UPI000C775AEA|nr:DUF5667 domain-containing protein [Bacillus sp. T33-2]PLR95863.1 hypothetical protein CVD19_12585 [Bacillus sp. T33-2]